tara:strand:+ start:1367 stop:2089 length:723 start_codon:yes stop_codon:yes gene_type:complete
MEFSKKITKQLISGVVYLNGGRVPSVLRRIYPGVSGSAEFKESKFGRLARVGRSSQIVRSTLSSDSRMGEHCKIYDTTLLRNVEVGRYTTLWGPGILLDGGLDGIKIGSFCSIGRGVLFYGANHSLDRVSTYFFEQNVFHSEATSCLVSKGPIIVGNDVWIGANSIILPGVQIGDGSVIAAGSVVVKDVPNYSIVGGNPAKVLKYRFSEERRAELSELAWWGWPIEKIQENRNFFSEPVL